MGWRQDWIRQVTDAAATLEATPLKGTSVAVFGGSGLIGSTLLALLRAARDRIGDSRTRDLCVARHPPDIQLPSVDYATGSVLDPGLIDRIPSFEHGVYLAGRTSNYLDDPIDTVLLSTRGVDSFLRAGKSARGLVLASSARVYGRRLDATPLSEESICALESPDVGNVYDASKLVGEAFALRARDQGQRVVIARLGNVYGPAGRRTATALTEMVAQAIDRRRITVANPGALRNQVYALDAAVGLLRALMYGEPAAAFNVGSSEHVTNETLARQVAASLPWPVEVILPPSTAAPRHIVLSIERARRQLGYNPHYDLASGLPVAVGSILHRDVSAP